MNQHEITYKQTVGALILLSIVYGIGGIAVFFVVNIWQPQYDPFGGVFAAVIYWLVVTCMFNYMAILQGEQ